MTEVTEPLRADVDFASEDYPLSAGSLFCSQTVLVAGIVADGVCPDLNNSVRRGARLVRLFSFSTLMIIIILGNLILGVYCGALGYIAAKSGLTTVLMARFSFGNVGSRWVDFIMGATQIGWYAFTHCRHCAGFNGAVLNIPQNGFLYAVLVFVFNYGFCATGAYIGYRAIDWLSRLAVPAMLVLVAISPVAGSSRPGWRRGTAPHLAI